MLKLLMQYIIIFLIPFLFLACSSKRLAKNEPLSALLFKVTLSENEALRLSYDIKNYSKTLKQAYKLTSFANFNNFLVNIGVKKRGLCWELAYDMLDFLKSKNYRIDYYIGGANIDNYWKEHNVLVLTCKGCEFQNGVVIDTWRYGGELYFSRVDKDKDFEWSQRGNLR